MQSRFKNGGTNHKIMFQEGKTHQSATQKKGDANFLKPSFGQIISSSDGPRREP
jgi:hypothetical protein